MTITDNMNSKIRNIIMTCNKWRNSPYSHCGFVVDGSTTLYKYYGRHPYSGGATNSEFVTGGVPNQVPLPSFVLVFFWGGVIGIMASLIVLNVTSKQALLIGAAVIILGLIILPPWLLAWIVNGVFAGLIALITLQLITSKKAKARLIR